MTELYILQWDSNDDGPSSPQIYFTLEEQRAHMKEQLEDHYERRFSNLTEALEYQNEHASDRDGCACLMSWCIKVDKQVVRPKNSFAERLQLRYQDNSQRG